MEWKLQEQCTICPRECKVNRANGQVGACHETTTINLARAALHMWEEPCISGDEGSGTVFFSGCSLNCCYCQNREIASGEIGREVRLERLVEIFFELKEKGANNINLVTPTHYTPQIVNAIKMAKAQGFDLPFVYNCSGYEKVQTLKLLEGLIDIYLTDFKYWYPKLAKRYSNAPDYKEVCLLAIEEMVRQTGSASFDERGMMKSGVIVRNLLLPGQVEQSKEIVRYLYETYHDNIYLSLMNQFTPLSPCKELHTELARKVTEEEYDELIDYAIDLGVENAFVQEGETASESFIPSFDYEGV